MLADIDLRKVGRTRLEVPVAELAQLAAATDRHLGQNLSLFEVGVECNWTVAQLTLHRGVHPVRVVGVLDVVTHRAGFVSATAAPRYGPNSPQVSGTKSDLPRTMAISTARSRMAARKTCLA